MNKTELAGKIKLLEGLTEDEKSALLGLLHEQKKYGLVWEDKPEDVEQKMEDELPILKEVKERAIISDDPSAPNHILIEGDNLHALTALTYTHQGKIDVIYIDPPYNTGNKDFIYNDSFVDKEDGYRHSKWLSFMSKRLKIAKQLLSEKGVIFISIDDNEQANLKLLCDSGDLFGENKFVGQIVWFKKRKGSFLSNKLISLTEYILAYSSKSDIQLFGGLPSNTESQPIIKRTNSPKVLFFPAGIVKTKLSNGNYPKGIYGKGTSASELIEDVIVENGLFISDLIIKASFVWGQDFLDEEIAKGTEIIVNTKNFQVRVIRHNNDSIKAMPSFIDGREEKATNEDAYELLKELFSTDNPFQYSKPINLIKKLVLSNSYFNKDITILDFFAGSGTTLHATLELNKDGGRRQCILVTNNENNICEEVTYMRSKKVIQGYTTPKGEEIEGLKNNTLRYYRTDFVPREQTNKNKRALMAAATDLLCIKNDVYTEQNTFGGRKLKPNAARYFDNGKTQMLLIYNELAVEAFASMLKEIEVEGKIKIYVFSNNRYAYNDNFENVLDKVELCALPAAIYDAYKKVLKPQKVKENVSQESISEEYVFEKTQGEIDFSEEGGEQ